MCFFFKLNTGSWSALCFLYLWSIIPQKKCFKTEQLQLCSFFFSLGFQYQTSKEEHWRRLWTSRIPPRPLYDLPSKAEKNITWRGIYVLQPGHHPPPLLPNGSAALQELTCSENAEKVPTHTTSVSPDELTLNEGGKDSLKLLNRSLQRQKQKQTVDSFYFVQTLPVKEERVWG